MKARRMVFIIVAVMITPMLFAQAPGPATQPEPTPIRIEPSGVPPAKTATLGVSDVACYFGTAKDSTWNWGLTPSNAYFSLSGEFKYTPFTKLQKFFAEDKTDESILRACAQSKQYYKITKPFFAAFAATSVTGSNYPIVLSTNVELYPQY